MSKYHAHKSKDGRLQSIADHANGTAQKAKRFANVFGFADEAYAAGRFHDAGKCSPDFLARLNGDNVKYEHSSTGMYMFAKRALDPFCPSRETDMLIAFAIAGHHSGLPDTGSGADTEIDNTFVAKMKRAEAARIDLADCESELGELPELRELPRRFKPKKDDFYSYQFLGRMLFSSLVDADFLDTEEFMSNGKTVRDGGESFRILRERFDTHMKKFDEKDGKLNRARSRILESCRGAASSEKGIYRLTVPTGGGKTLSSVAFALGHLEAHKMKRIIYVIPYVSIIRQTVEIFEEIFGAENVLGHYGTADFVGSETGERSSAELAAENWDKPLIVTTNVQFFESLHSNGTSNCRKLHNIADSVIVFDEAQMLPTELLRPCLGAMSELVKNYGCTAVLCTATQPALEKLLSDNGIEAKEICRDMPDIFPVFERVKYENLGVIARDTLYERLGAEKSGLCVLNSKEAVRECYEMLKGEGVYHLSTYMTPSHIGKCIKEIKKRLLLGEKCLVISTSLIEAGVDIDFPVVYREMAGLDSIIQSGGRCNREGKNTAGPGKVYIFESDKPSEMFSGVSSITKRIIELYPDISSPEAIHDYFERLYEVKPSEESDKLDEKGILGLINQREDGFKGMTYREVARRFRYIEDDQRHILIPNSENAEECAAVRNGKLSRGIFRKISKDLVSVYENKFDILERSGVLSWGAGDIAVLEDPAWYDSKCGLLFKETGEAVFG